MDIALHIPSWLLWLAGGVLLVALGVAIGFTVMARLANAAIARAIWRGWGR